MTRVPFVCRVARRGLATPPPTMGRLHRARRSRTLGAMAGPDPKRSVEALLPGITIEAAGIFGLQDRTAAVGLLGEAGVTAALAGLVRPPAQQPAPGQPPDQELLELQQAAAWAPVSLLLAVSASAVHVCSWHPEHGAGAEVARFDRASMTSTLERHGAARRLIITEPSRGYRLALTATVSRLGPYGAGTRAVLDLLPAMAPPAVQAPPATGAIG